MGTFSQAINRFGEEKFFYGKNKEEPYHVNKVQVDFSAYDSESGISKIIVRERLLYNVNGESISELSTQRETEFLVNEFPYNSSIQSSTFIYDFSKVQGTDGIVELSFIPVDYCGNYETDESKNPVFAMVRDTGVTYLFSAKKEYFTDKFSSMENYYLETYEQANYFSLQTSSYNDDSDIMHDYLNDIWASYNGTVYKTEPDLEKDKCYCGRNKNSLVEVSPVEKVKNEEENNIGLLYKKQDYSRSEDFYFKIIGTDSVGNVKEFEFCEPALNIAYFEIAENEWDSNEKDLLIHMPSINYMLYGEINYSCFYTTKADLDSLAQTDSTFKFTSKITCKYQSDNWENECVYVIEEIEDKDYYIYTNGYWEGENGNYMYDYSYQRIVINPYDLIDKNITAPQISSNNTFESMGPNTGTYLLTVNISEEELDNFDSIYLKITSQKDETSFFPLKELKNEILFDSKECGDYKYQLIGNKNNISSKSDEQTISINTPNYLSYSFNVAVNPNNYPDIFGNSLVFNKPDLTYFDFDDDGNYSIRFYYRPHNKVQVFSLDELSYMDLKVNKNEEQILIPLEIFYNQKGVYNTYLFIEDKYNNNNSSDILNVYSHTFGHRFDEYEEKVSLVEVTSDDVKFQVKHKNDKYFFFPVKYFNGKEWLLPTDLQKKDANANRKGMPYNELTYKGYLSDDKAIFSLKENDKLSDATKFRNTIDKKFIKIAYESRGENYAEEQYFIAPYYYYIDTDTSCSLKKLGDSTSIVTVHNDKPVLVQLVYGTVNFGMQPEKWEHWCSDNHKVNTVIYESSVNADGVSTPHYYYVDNSDVPFGSYYTVIAHYADGTSKMTTPVKK